MAGFRAKRKKTCYFTDNKVEKIDWTNYELLRSKLQNMDMNHIF